MEFINTIFSYFKITKNSNEDTLKGELKGELKEGLVKEE